MLSALAALLLQTAFASSPSEKILERYRKAVVMIDIVVPGRGQVHGTGFFVSPDGELITNYHVFQFVAENPSAQVTFTLGNGRTLKRYRVGRCRGGSDSRIDLCLLKLAIYPETHFRARGASPSAGTPVYWIGNPRGRHFQIGAGEFVGNFDHDNFSEVEVSVPLIGGQSGGPIFSATGDLVGVVTHSVSRNLSLVPKHLQPKETHELGIAAKEVMRFQQPVLNFVEPEDYFWRAR